MRRNKVLSILLMTMLVLPLIPQFLLPGTAHTYDKTSAHDFDRINAPGISGSSATEISPHQPTTSQDGLQSPDPTSPVIPNNRSRTGASRVAQLTWNISQTFTNRNQMTDYQVHIDKGMLYHDLSNFTRIGDITSNKSASMVEDHDPMTGWRYYWPMDEKTWPGEVTFMAFNISGKAPVQITEFVIYVYCPGPPDPVTEGGFNYTIYTAAPSGTSGLGTMPDLSSPVGPWMQTFVPSMPRYTEQWLPLPYAPVIIDSSMTYANTFYFALNMMPGAAVAWVLMEDVGIPPDGDGEDEGDAWNAYPWPSLNFISGPSVDFFLGYAYNSFPYPSNILMQVNGTDVVDQYPNPGIGIWDGGWHSPAINMSNADRYYNVTYLPVPGLTYDVTWLGWFYDILYANARFTAWAYHDWVDWEVSLYADFPVGALDQKIYVSIEDDWTVLEVLVDGLPHFDWSYYYSPTSGWFVEIEFARTGEWTILCDSPDYIVDSEILNSTGQVTTWANGSGFVTARAYVEDGFGQNATTGWGEIIVFDPRTNPNAMNISALMMPPGGEVDVDWSVWLTSTVAGLYTIHIIWFNGTEAGMDVQTLDVYMLTNLIVTYEFPPSGEPVIRGDTVHIEVYYYNQWGYAIDDAVVTVINDSSGLEWGLGLGDSVIDYDWYNWAGEGFPGYYTAILFTDNATIGILHNVTMYLSSPFNEGQSTSKDFEVKTRETQIVFFWQGRPLPGLNNISDDWYTSPHPYINDTSLQFTIRYTDGFGLPITGAQLTPYIVHESQGVFKRLDWIDLSIADPTKPGLYNITIDTNPIMGRAFHEGDPAYIVIHASKFGYESTWSDDIDVQPQPRPSFIDVPQEFQTIVLYQDWQYPTIEHPIILRVVLRDFLNGEDLSHGTVKAGVNGGQNTTLTLATPGLGLYEISSLSTAGLVPGEYNVTIYAEASDFVDSITTITLTILAKQTVAYNVESNFDNLQIPNHGLEWWINLQLYLENSTGLMTSSSYYKSSKQSILTVLPPGTEISLTITASTGNYDPIIGIIGSDGWVQFEGVLTHEGQHNFYISLEGAENYVAITNMEISPSSQGVYVMSMSSILTQNLPMLIAIAAVIFVVPSVAGFAYRRYVILPKRQKRLAKYQAIADTFSDVANLNRLLVLHKESGICVFDPFAEESQDATLVAGFLQAISTFGHDLADSPGLTNGEKSEVTALRELQYEGFRILIHDGQFVRNALVLGGVPSEQLRERLENFTKAFETRYKGDFEHWDGRVDQFNSASDLVEEIFLISLRHPHTVAARKPRGTQLTSLESDIYSLSKELTKDREYVFLGQILSTYLAAGKASNLEALMAIYQLRVKGLFEPLQLPPIPPSGKSAG